jgi:hypothetical protein
MNTKFMPLWLRPPRGDDEVEVETALPLEPLLLAAVAPAAIQRTTPAAADRPRNNEPAATSVTTLARLLRIGDSAARNP